MTMPVIQTDLEPAVCAGCGGPIHDRYYLMAVDRPWHVACLKCAECHLPLDSEATCFARDSSIYCKEDYYRLFALKKCSRCQLGISTNELVMRAKDHIFHVNCFTCAACSKVLTTGEQFGMTRDGLIFCKVHYELHLQGDCNFIHNFNNNNNDKDNINNNNMLPPGAFLDNHPGLSLAPMTSHGAPPFYNGIGVTQKGRPRKRKSPLPDGDLAHMSVCMGPDGEFTSIGHDGTLQIQAPRQKRMRTSFKHHQLRIMKSYFALNHNPDAKDLKQLAQKTGLSKRVLQVWFQNARAKYRRNVLKQDGDKKGGSEADVTSQSGGDGVTSDMDVSLSDGGQMMTKLEPADMDSVDYSDSNSSHSFCDLQAMEQSLECGHPAAAMGHTSSMGLTELFKSEFYE